MTQHRKNAGRSGVFLLWLSWMAHLAGVFNTNTAAADSPASPDYSAVEALFGQHCLDCHAAKDPEGGLVLDTFESLMQGGETGAAVIPGKGHESLLIQMVEGRFEKNGKTKIMPPGKRRKLTAEQIAIIKAWIDSGAKAPAAPIAARELVFPKIGTKGSPRNPVNSLAYSDPARIIAAGRYAQVELRRGNDLQLIRTLRGLQGNVNAVLFSPNAPFVLAAGGQPALGGEVRQWNFVNGEFIQAFSGHKDAIYALALTPDGKTLATGSYDQKIKLWDMATGKELKTLSGHNGCVYALAFRPDGKILGSASADRTVKLWDVASGERRATFSQSLKEVYALAFSPDNRQLVSGGADNRIRVWEISETAAENTNPLLHSKFAHEGAILNLVFSPDSKTLVSAANDRTIKLWDLLEMKERAVLETQPDWPQALAFGEGSKVFVGRLDGSIGVYDVSTGKPIVSLAVEQTMAEAKPAIIPHASGPKTK